jgi:L-alanine-DL-glutamate epimerase-like enolase superfamily enzyme
MKKIPISQIPRRTFLKNVMASVGLAVHRRSAARQTPNRAQVTIRPEAVSYSFAEFKYRAPYKFGGVPVDRATILNVSIKTRSNDGRTATGFGSMPLGNVWSFPSREMAYETTLGAMKTLAARIAKITGACPESGHPLDLNLLLEPEWLKAAAEVSRELKLTAPIPKLCTLVTASAFDAALHDAYGRTLRLNCWRTYGADLMTYDLAHYLNSDFRGEYPDRYVLTKPQPRMAMYHSVGGADPITASDIQRRLNDGLPETLPEWIRYNGLTHIKIKLQGEDLKWDIDRVVTIDRVARETRPGQPWTYCADFNERCPNVEYVLEFLRRVKELTPRGFAAIQYIEQPTARDLRANRQNVMHEANKLRPVVIDESLVDLESLLLAREMGYTGVALKACKGQSHAVLMAAAAQKYKMFLCVQDLTCPGASLVHSVSIAAHVPGVAGVEHNSRQYMPAANKPWEKKFPGLFIVKDGSFRTAGLNNPGLGVVG